MLLPLLPARTLHGSRTELVHYFMPGFRKELPEQHTYGIAEDPPFAVNEEQLLDLIKSQVGRRDLAYEAFTQNCSDWADAMLKDSRDWNQASLLAKLWAISWLWFESP